MQKILESVPNFSEGRDSKKLEKIAACFRGHQGIKLLDYSGDYDHNRSVFTIIGEPEAVVAALLDVIGLAIDLIDLNQHQGQHPYIGAVDVIPLIPIQGMDMTEADQYAKSLAEKAADKYGLPSYLYEKSASSPQRENLADIRRGQYGNLSEKMQDAAWQPDFGPSYPHPTAGCTAIGARLPLIAFNVCLNTDDLE
ncbi:MAG: glutamate formimidoyltransferase, partial [Clostridiales bacterium]